MNTFHSAKDANGSEPQPSIFPMLKIKGCSTKNIQEDQNKISNHLGIWKIGDWCYFDYLLHQVVKTENGMVTDLDNGILRVALMGLMERCVPLTISNKIISDWFALIDKKLLSIPLENFNYEDFHQLLKSKWLKACLGPVSETQTHCIEAEKIVSAICKNVEEVDSWNERMGTTIPINISVPLNLLNRKILGIRLFKENQ